MNDETNGCKLMFMRKNVPTRGERDQCAVGAVVLLAQGFHPDVVDRATPQS